MDTLDKMDLLAGSGFGMAADMGASMYSDSLFAKALGGETVDGVLQFNTNLPDGMASKLESMRNARIGAKAKAFHPLVSLKETFGLPGKRNTAIIDSANEYVFRQVGANKDMMAKILSRAPKIHSKILEARSAATLSKALSGVWIGAAAASVVTSVVKSFREKGANEMSKRYGFDNNHFADSSMAQTTRQRALRAISQAGGGYRRALGNEANFQHTTR